jgi:phospholipid-binding lipoprotein MlaA
VRDGLGRIPDSYGNPANWITHYWEVHYGLWALNLLDARYRLLPLDATLDSAYDPYLFMKNAYLQRRDFLIHGGQPSNNNESDADKLLDQAEKDESQQETPTPSPTPTPK